MTIEEQYNQLFGDMLDIKKANLITNSDGKREFYNLFFETIRKSLADIETYIKNQEYPANDVLIEFTQKTYKVSALYLLHPAQITSVNARANYNLDGELVNYCTITLASGEMFFTLMTLDDISQAINNLTN